MQKWTVEISLSDDLVAEGIDISKPGWLHYKLMRALPFVSGSKIECKVISTPDSEVIRMLQGDETQV